MIVLNTKTFDELQGESLKELTSIGFSDSPGTIARLFLSVVNKNIDTLYKVLTTNHLRAFLSTSDGAALNAIGALLNCSRNSGETDDDYKYRISQQCLILASSNETAVRLAVLSTDGVADIKMKPYAMGAGTFSVIVVLEDGVDETTVLNNVTAAINKTYAYGIKFKVTTPTLTYIKLKIKVYLKDTVSDADAQTIRYDVQSALADYIAGLAVGEDIVVDQITQTVLNVSDSIISHQCLEFKINNEKALYVNQSCRWFERFALSTDVDNIVIS
jgi:hypothetical protein